MKFVEFGKNLNRFMRSYADPFNFASYRKTPDGKEVFRARTKEVLVEKFAQGKRVCRWRFHELLDHLKRQSTFRLGFSSKMGTVVLLMLDLDTDKTCPTRQKDLQVSMRKLRSKLSNVYFEDSTYSDDKHGFILVSLPERYGRLRLRQVMLKAVQVLGKELPLKKLEIMGLPAVYDWVESATQKTKSGEPAKLIAKVTKSGTVAKVPRPKTVKDLNKLLNLGTINISVFEQISASANATAEEPRSSAPSNVSLGGERGGVEDILLSGIKPDTLNKTSLSESNIKTFTDLWELVTFEDQVCCEERIQTQNGKAYTKKRYITKTEWSHYCLAWMMSVTRFDKNIEGRSPEHQSTVHHEWIDNEYEQQSGMKVDQKKRRWVMKQLLNWQILLGRNLTWHEGVSRKFGWSWGRLQAILKEGAQLSFSINAEGSNFALEGLEDQR